MSESESARVQTCDLCIVGAGIAGLNALFAASRYLTRDQKVILVDRRPRAGGMWVDVYSYVHLHQPHPMFTAGNIAWTLGKDRGYLASKDEVLDHFEHCLDVIRERVQVEECYGWAFQSHEEVNGRVRVNCRAGGGRTLVVTANRLIKAYGLGVTTNEPLRLSSHRVHSVSPDYCDVRTGAIADNAAPVWIIGGGKTAMDTAHAVITEYPGREVNLVAGQGTFFARRDSFFPSGTRRWWQGTPLNKVAAQMGHRYDGTNEAEVREWFRASYGTFLTPQADNYVLGVLSEAENRTISAGLNDVVMDYLEDVVDRMAMTELVFRSGATKAIEPGSWIVNCTGYVKFEPEVCYEPYVSPSGAVVSINVRSAVLHLPAFMGYFLGHLLFLDKLRDVPLYEVDWQELKLQAPMAFPYVLFALAQYNLSLIYDNVPGSVFKENGLDFDTWYPLPRRLAGLARFVLTHRRERERQRHVLDTVRERFQIRCGPVGEHRASAAAQGIRM